LSSIVFVSYDTKIKKTAPEPASVTAAEHGAFQQAYDFYNRTLFRGRLPSVLITLPRRSKRNYGYFSRDKFHGRVHDGHIHEIALNPDHFGRTDTEILSTLVHEMVHCQQQEEGHPGRGRYHNKEWGQLMGAVGLFPSDTGKKGGRTTGQQMMHYVLPDGPFARATAQLLATGFTLRWQSGNEPRAVQRRRQVKAASKTKFTCPNCGLNCWAKPDAQLLCGVCYEDGRELVVLEPVPL
jgi:hypothetical protein